MKYCTVFFLLFPIFTSAAEIPLEKGMIINKSITIIPGNYFFSADTTFRKPLIIIDGKDIIVDFNNAILQDTTNIQQPDKFHGLAILIKKGSSNIILKNANI